MKSHDIVSVVNDWLAKNASISGPILPDGWFGRPYDNLYQHNEIQVVCSNDGIRVDLDSNTRLIIYNLLTVEVEKENLVFKDFDRVVFSWGTKYENTKEFTAGNVKLVSMSVLFK